MASKYYDTTAVLQVIGNVYNNPSLLGQTDKYSITDEDFANSFHRIVFGCIYKLYELGAKKITIANITDFLADRPKLEAEFKQNKGEEWLMRITEGAIPDSFDYYYNRLKKFSLLRAYDNFGMDVRFLYDPDNILDGKKKQLQEDFLDNSTLDQIATKIDEKIESIKIKYVDDVYDDAMLAGEGIEELIDKLKEKPEIGIPLYGPLINTVTKGARLGKFYLRSAPTGMGKAIPNYTLIPTPSGWKKVEDIKVGDKLFGQKGEVTTVLKVFPQIEDKEIWKVAFADGRIAECCKDHLWTYRYDSHRGYSYRTESIEDIYNRSLKLKNGLKDSDNRGYRFQIQLNEPVQYSTKKYSVEPYTMGALIGDGSFRFVETNKALTFSSENEEIPNYIARSLGEGWYPKKNSHYNFNYTFKHISDEKHNLWVTEILKDYPELIMCKSEDKFIPRIYLEGDVSQRYALLQGLMDTDGSIDEKGRTNFTTISEQLKNDVIELCHSLGMVVSCHEDIRSDKYTTGKCFNLHIQAKKEVKPLMFKVKRKKERALNYAASNKRSEYKETIGIVSIEKTGKKVPMTCFMVDNENHLFLMNDFIVTHNSRTMCADACYIGTDTIYEPSFGSWIKTTPAQPVLYISTELDLSEVQTMMLSFVSAVNEDHILTGRYVGDEEDRVRFAAKLIKESKIYVEYKPDFSLKDIEDIIKKNIREHDIHYVFYDYIHTSMKILEEISRRSGGVRLREDNALFMLSVTLKDICTTNDVFIMSSTQLNGDWKDSETPDQNLLRGAKAIADKIDWGAVMLPVTQPDKEKLQRILQSTAFDIPTIKISVYKNRRGKYKGVYLWCRADLGTCRVEPMFVTDYSYELQQVPDLKILMEEDLGGAF